MMKQVILALMVLHAVNVSLAHGTNTLNMKRGLWPLMKEPISVLCKITLGKIEMIDLSLQHKNALASSSVGDFHSE